MAAILNADAYKVGAPLWWVNRLYERLVARRPDINKWDDYYRGDFPLPWLAPQAQDEFRRVLKMARANYMGLVIDAMCERMAVEGFRIPEEDDDAKPGRASSVSRETTNSSSDSAKADRETWAIWQENGMDAQFDQALLEAAITGQSYLLVAPNPKDSTKPLMWVEHSSQTIIAFKPGTNRRERMAALKVYEDEWTGDIFATLYLENLIWKFSSTGKTHRMPIVGAALGTISEVPIWSLRRPAGDEQSADRNPLGLVPMFELPNNPRLLSGGQSEIYDLTDSQDRIVKTIVDRLMTQDYGAFPQKWATGWPEYQEDGTPTPPIAVGRDRMITTEVVETKLGQFTAADLAGYIAAKPEDVKDIASRSRTPAQYLLGEMNNVNGDTLKASESGLVAKVRQRFRGHDDPLEDGVNLAREIAGLGRRPGIETIWRNPEFRTEGELVDALLKMNDLGVPEEALWERWGATPQEIGRWKSMLEEKMRRAAAGDATVVLAERFRAAAAGPVEAQQEAALSAKTNANGGGGLQGGGGPNGNGTQPGQARGSTGTGNPGRGPGQPLGAKRSGGQSGGQSSANAKKRRPNAPKPSTT